MLSERDYINETEDEFWCFWPKDGQLPLSLAHSRTVDREDRVKPRMVVSSRTPLTHNKHLGPWNSLECSLLVNWDQHPVTISNVSSSRDKSGQLSRQKEMYKFKWTLSKLKCLNLDARMERFSLSIKLKSLNKRENIFKKIFLLQPS